MASIARYKPQSSESGSPWRGFRSGLWEKEINVRAFILQNYEP